MCEITSLWRVLSRGDLGIVCYVGVAVPALTAAPCTVTQPQAGGLPTCAAAQTQAVLRRNGE